MFKLLRRISVGAIPRPDRPWDEDPTSNAPRTTRKRRLSSAERDDADEGKAGKKVRGDTASPSVADADATFLAPATPETDTREVKEVTQGVGEVELADRSEKVLVTDAAPETIPLPEENSGELDEPASDDVDDMAAPTDGVGVSDGTGSTQGTVEQSTPLTEDCEGLKHDEEVKEEPTSDVAEPTNDVDASQVLNHP